jgi:hypothetical protein
MAFGWVILSTGQTALSENSQSLLFLELQCTIFSTAVALVSPRLPRRQITLLLAAIWQNDYELLTTSFLYRLLCFLRSYSKFLVPGCSGAAKSVIHRRLFSIFILWIFGVCRRRSFSCIFPLFVQKLGFCSLSKCFPFVINVYFANIFIDWRGWLVCLKLFSCGAFPTCLIVSLCICYNFLSA